MPGRGKWTRRILACILITGAGLGTTYTWGLPWIIRMRIMRKFSDTGFPGARFRVTQATLSRTRLEDIALTRENRFGIRKIILAYDPRQALAGNFDSITVSGISLTLNLNEHNLGLGPLAAFRASPGRKFRFRGIRITDSILLIKSRMGVMSIRFSGRVKSNGNTCVLTACGALQDLTFKLNTRINIAANKFCSLDIELAEPSGRNLASLLRHLDIPVDFNLKGPTSLRAHAETHQGAISGNGIVRAESLHVPLGKAEVQVRNPLVKISFQHPYTDQNLPERMIFNITAGSSTVSRDQNRLAVGPVLGTVTIGITQNRSISVHAQSSSVGMSYTSATRKRAMELAFSDLALDLQAASTTDGIRISTATVTAAQTAINAPDYGSLQLTQVKWQSAPNSIGFPRSGSGTAASGLLRTGAIIAGLDSPTVRLNGNKVSLDLTAAFAFGAKVRVQARIDLDNASPVGRMDFKVPGFAVKNRGRALYTLLPMLRGYIIDGNLAATGAVEFNRTGLTSSVGTIELHGIDLLQPGSRSGLRDIRGAVHMSSLWPPRSKPNQHLRAGSIFTGEHAGRNVLLVFAVNSPDRIRIKHAECAWGGGKLMTDNALVWRAPHPQANKPGPWRARLDLRMEAVRLQDLIDLLYPGRVKAEGLLYGHLPVSYNQARTRALRLGNGLLEARPPRGIISMREDDARRLLGIERVVPLEKADMEEAGKLVIMQALQDMEYNRLVCRFIDDPKGWYAQIDTSGKGPRGRNPFPVGQLRVNIREDLEKIVNLAIINPRALRAMLAGMLESGPDTEAVKQEKKNVDAAIDAYF